MGLPGPGGRRLCEKSRAYVQHGTTANGLPCASAKSTAASVA